MSAWGDIADLEIQIGELLGVGGGSWAVDRRTGGQTGPAQATSPGTWAGYVVEERGAALSAAAPATAVAAKTWAAVATSAALALQAGDVLTSQANGLKFVVISPDRVEGYARYLVEAR